MSNTEKANYTTKPVTVVKDGGLTYLGRVICDLEPDLQWRACDEMDASPHLLRSLEVTIVSNETVYSVTGCVKVYSLAGRVAE